MGRLGFNLVGQKDVEKTPQTEVTMEKPEKMPVEETVVVVDKLENEKNESSEESCLRAEIQAKNLTISKLRALSICLGLGLILIIGLVLCYSFPQQCSQPQDDDAVMQLLQEKFHLSEDDTLLITSYIGARENRPEAARLEMQPTIKMMAIHSCTNELSAQKSMFEEQNRNTMSKFNMLQDNYMVLQSEKDALAAELTHKREMMQGQIAKLENERADLEKKIEDGNKKLQEERADLEKKIEAGNKKLQELQQRNSRQQQQQQVAVKTTTEQPSRGLFGDGQLKKFNDLVKDIETVGRLFTNVFIDAI